MTPEEIRKIVQDELEKWALSSLKIPNHAHNGVDAQRIQGRDIVSAPQTALTAANSSSFSGAGTGTTSAEVTILNNMRTRIGELETALRKLGFIN